MGEPTKEEIIAALEAAANSLGDARSMSCSDEIPKLYEDSRAVKVMLARLRGE